jgi:hypothetical protein
LAAFGVGLMSNRTTVDDVDICRIGKQYTFVTFRFQPILNRCGVVLVHFTAQRSQGDAQGTWGVDTNVIHALSAM